MHALARTLSMTMNKQHMPCMSLTEHSLKPRRGWKRKGDPIKLFTHRHQANSGGLLSLSLSLWGSLSRSLPPVQAILFSLQRLHGEAVDGQSLQHQARQTHTRKNTHAEAHTHAHSYTNTLTYELRKKTITLSQTCTRTHTLISSDPTNFHRDGILNC